MDSDIVYLRKQEIKKIQNTLKHLHNKRNAYLKRFRETDNLHYDVLADNVAREIDAENIALAREKRLLGEINPHARRYL